MASPSFIPLQSPSIWGSINSSKIFDDIGWTPKESFESGIFKTVNWYLENTEWLKELMSEEFEKWMESQYK